MKLINIYNLGNDEEFNEAIQLVEKTIDALDDLEDYYYKLEFNEDMREMRRQKEWWQKKLTEIKAEFIEFKRNKELIQDE